MQGPLNGVFSGKHLQPLHTCTQKLVFEAMERLRFEAFLDTQSTEQKGEIIGLAKEIHGNLKQEGIESHSANSILNEMAKR